MSETKEIRIVTEPGIGDFLFLWKKLANAPAEDRMRMTVSVQQQEPRRAESLFPMLGIRFGGYMNVSRQEIHDKSVSVTQKWADVRDNFDGSQENYLWLQTNTHLESGKRLEETFPDLPFKELIYYDTGFEASAFAHDLLHDKKAIAIYTSSYHMAHWGHWKSDQWVEFIRLLADEWKDATFVHIGAEFDTMMGHQVASRVGGLDLVGKTTLAQCIEIIRRCRFLVGFHSGIPIIAGTLNVPYVTFFPKHLVGMMHKWEPDRKYKSDQVLNFPMGVSPRHVFDKMVFDTDHGWNYFMD